MPRRPSQQHPAGGSTIGATNAPTFFGRIDTTVEALRLVRAAQLGLVPRIRRRLNMEEREKMVVSGAVFVFSVAEASMQRWTDGKMWSPSRIDGNFLVSGARVYVMPYVDRLARPGVQGAEREEGSRRRVRSL
ncbi:hypothetical protein FIBSPDRAFT_876964 [Athelia psychrophila]|uniref:Gluconate transport inducer 1/Pac2 n=1 Tax=Athelia psychrophila TaxID=1759441 RepID=A0A167WD75_9AGAM|nr:hypothetical protein FIBSPDRAFT_876964 [Fibularhizoctonia sp. CBS 109695]